MMEAIAAWAAVKVSCEGTELRQWFMIQTLPQINGELHS